MSSKFRDGITAERVREALDYNPETGAFVWRRYQSAKSRRWNTRFAGKSAGSLQTFAHGKKTYLVIRIDDVLYLAHRLAWVHVHGVWPDRTVDQEDGDGTHNWIGNLRLATQQQQTFNRGAQSNSQSGHKGIQKRGNSYRVRVASNGYTDARTFSTLEKAKAWHKKATAMLHGSFAHQPKETADV